MALSKGKKLGIIAIIFTTVALAVGGAVFALKNSNLNSGITNNPNNPIVTPDNPTPNNPIVTPDNPTPDNPIVTPDNPIVTPEDPTPDPEPDVPVIDQTTEAEYKAMFEADLPGVVENYFNENLAKFSTFNISNIKINTINNATGTIYINCVQQNVNKFMELNCESLKNATNYQTLSKNVSKMSFTTKNNKGVTVQEEGFANEIAEFAFEQTEVKNYLSENGLNASDLKVLNATEFSVEEGGYLTTNIKLKSENSIFSVKLAGRTGTCSSEEEYLTKFKNGYLEKVTMGETVEYKELETKDAVSYNFNGTASAKTVSYQIVAKHNGQTYVIGEGLDY